jgi:hypothetical protein
MPLKSGRTARCIGGLGLNPEPEGYLIEPEISLVRRPITEDARDL